MADTLLADQAEVTIDQNKNYLEELVGENKKFKSPEDLARGKYESDAYIEIMKRRQDELRDDYMKLKTDYEARAKLEELIDQMSKRPQQSTEPDSTQRADDVRQPQFDPKQVESLVSNKIQEYELTKKQSENFNLVKEKLTERYGNNFKPALEQQITELGITSEDVDTLARRNPKLLLKSLGLDKPVETENFQTPQRSSQRSDSFGKTGPKKKTWSYYQELKKQNPQLYYDPKTAVEIHNSAIELGEEFKDGDYSRFGPN